MEMTEEALRAKAKHSIRAFRNLEDLEITGIGEHIF